ncbi:efflux RND transporter periplasmic adaptor subunit [Candidatus Magnetaquicoccus inordinatus]|uniref:efflux RND transporter periplasmic adaptor subunit n=1 Tax=Candidatus Magnetaquicoccus inordinatus TaxID=2496818 RepID=UPI00102B23D3|nr:efflux RND transporter periplasmic adaptor subunit [Candidatus Magnetaquicoccus inordinatus]
MSGALHSLSVSSDFWSRLGQGQSTEQAAVWLSCLISLFGARVEEAVVLMAEGSQGLFRPRAFWPVGSAQVSADLAHVCEQALQMRRPLSVQRQRGLLAQPIERDGLLVALVAVAFQDAVPAHAGRYLRWGEGWLLGEWQQQEGQESAELQERLLLVVDLLRVALEADPPAEAVHAVVTEAASRLGCDRVAVGFAKKGVIRLAALSNAAEVAQRIDLVAALEAAMHEAWDQAATVRVGLYTIDGEAADEQTPSWLDIREHQRLVRDFGAEFVLSQPFALGEKERRQEGVFVFEWPDALHAPGRVGQAEALAPILGRVLLERERAGRSNWRRLGDFLREERRRLFAPGEAVRKLLALAVVAVVVAGFTSYGEHRLSAKALVEGSVRRVIVAPFDGYVAASQVRAGYLVKEGEELARLDDRELRLESLRWASQQQQYQKQMDDAQAQHNLAQIQIAKAQARQAEAQRELSEAMLKRARVLAPFSGLLLSGDLSQHLGGAVKKGQTLFELAPLDAYRVVLQVEEGDISYLTEQQRGSLMVAALPGVSFPFHITLITPVATITDGSNHFRVEGTLEVRDERLRPGMEGIGKLDVGQQRWVWIWSYRLLAWIRLHIWSWLGI